MLLGCGARRMVESAALLVDEVLPRLIQRIARALNLNVHVHMLFLDGVYVIARERAVFHRLPGAGSLHS